MPESPANQGYAMPAMTSTVSPAAAAIRGASIRANPGSHHIHNSSQSVLDQEKLVCCVSCALASAMEIMNPGWPALAPLFHYHLTRFDVVGGANADGFLFLDVALVTLATAGICRQDLHQSPYTLAGAAEKPSDAARADGLTRVLGRRGVRRRYQQVSGVSRVDWIREQLRLDRPVVVGIQLPTVYPDAFLNSKFEWLDPDRFPRSAVGHCVLATGFDDARDAIHIQDSHGTLKFESGRWWLGYRVVDSSIFQDAYSLIP